LGVGLRKIGENIFRVNPGLMNDTQIVAIAGVGIFKEFVCELEGVTVDILGEIKKLLFLIDEYGFVGALK
jgi:hypothetical protein